MIDAFTRVYELTGQARFLTVARDAADGLLGLFSDAERGGLFTTGCDAEALIVRPKEIMDNAVPSANSAAALALARLGAISGEERYLLAVDAMLRLTGELATKHPTAFGNALCALDLATGEIDQIVVCGDRPDLVAAVREAWRPDAVLAWGERDASALFDERVDGFAYVCRGTRCFLPAADPDTLRGQLTR